MAVYFIQNTRSKSWKIGFTSGNPNARLSQLQTGCEDKLELVGSIKAWGPNEEDELHRVFRDLHIRGEWFQDAEIIRIVSTSGCTPDRLHVWTKEAAARIRSIVLGFVEASLKPQGLSDSWLIERFFEGSRELVEMAGEKGVFAYPEGYHYTERSDA